MAILLNYSILNLSYDFLRVYDGSSVFDSEIGALTGIQTSEIISSGSDIFLNFLSDDSENKAGFRIQYEPGIKLLFLRK